MKNWGFGALLFLLLPVTEAKQFKRCELANTLKKAGLDNYNGIILANWVCMAYYESRFKSRALRGPDKDGARNYGIFQINGHRWCASGTAKPDFGCYTHCKKFTDDDITDDIACIKKIASNANNMNGWAGWRRHCKGRDLSRWTKGC